MRLVLAFVLWAFYALLLHTVWERFMSTAPAWVWQVVSFLFVVGGLVALLSHPPIWAFVWPPTDKPFSSTLIAGLIGAVIVGAAWWIFAARKPVARLDVVAIVSLADHPRGTVIKGIEWRQPYAEVNLFIGNPTLENYENLKLVLNSDHAIAGIGQLTSVQPMTLTVHGDAMMRPEIVHPDGSRTALAMSLIGNSYGYEIRFPMLEAKTAIRIVLATVSGFRTNTASDVRDPGHWLRFAQGDKAIWYGYGNRPDSIYEPKSPPKFVSVEGTYEIGNFQRKISQKVRVRDVFGEAAEAYRSKNKREAGTKP